MRYPQGAIKDVLPYKLLLKLGLGEPTPIWMTLQLADRSVRYPRGAIEDVLVKVVKLNFPISFVILGLDEDIEVPIILGHPFLATSPALIDVCDGKFILQVSDEEATCRLPTS